MYVLEEFVVVHAPMDVVDRVITERNLMMRWASPSVRFDPLDGWRFDEGAPWKLTLTGLGDVMPADYVVHAREPGLILWAYNGFWEGFDAWHWFPASNDPHGPTIIQNRLEYELRSPLLPLFWRFTLVPFMKWDAEVQMQRLKRVCEQEARRLHQQPAALPKPA
ncbi:MAG: SRPBCC family protein [Chloroflexaceae bacterium]|nr:SRPBCC family protein [Chloroflexaceae bacterium]